MQNQLINQRCSNSKTIIKLDETSISTYLFELTNWNLSSQKDSIVASFHFKNFKQTMFFVNALAFICEKECHHPSLSLGYDFCQVTFTTHDVNGLSINDFICAAKVNALLQ